ncbi:type III secretion system chaperone IpgE, partial [Shigella flexneri]|nr:type III secretion system chaperone IpgE [Shigella flexneri]
ICLATDDEGGSLIARLDLTGINEFEDIYVNTEYYISRVRWLKDEFARRMKGY